MTTESIRTVAGYMASHAKYLAKSCAPEDRDAAMAIARALKTRPADVVALVSRRTPRKTA